MKKDYYSLKKGYIFICLGLFVLDVIVKNYVFNNLPLMNSSYYDYPHGGIAVFQDILGVNFSINHISNLGAAWGLFAQYSSILLYLRICIIFSLFIYLFFYQKEKKISTSLVLILFGAICNVLDHFIYGHVVDMFHFNFWGYSFPLFNIADGMICIGISWMILSTFCKNRKSKIA